MIPSTEQLISIAREYWPSNMEAYHSPDTCPQFAKLDERWQHELARMERWEAFIRDLEADVPGFSIGNITATPDACLRCGVYNITEKPRTDYWVVVGCMSILAPVYTVYTARVSVVGGRRRPQEPQLFGPFPPEMQPIVDATSRRLEATFAVSALPRDVAETPIPLFVEPLSPPETTLFHALFTSVPASIP